MSIFNLAWLLAGLCVLVHCHHIPIDFQADNQYSLVGHQNLPHLKIAPGNIDFAFKLYHEVALGAAKKNIFFSPLGISTAFSMLALGAKSHTLSQLLSGLSFNQTEITEQEIRENFRALLEHLNNPSRNIELTLGNALFIDEEFKPLKKFLKDAKYFFKSDISHTNFNNSEEAEEEINSYIKKKTNGKLVDVVKGLDAEVVTVLVNYIFMKAHWKNPFNPSNTQEDYFFVDEHTTIKVPMMFRNGLYYTYHDTDLSCQVAVLPYQGTTSAFFVLPDPGKMKQVEDALGRELFLKWLNSLREQRINLHLPKFSISTKYVLKGILRRLGITDIFTNEANLSGITGKPDLQISKAFHQTYLNVHENGTEAAAATVIEAVPVSLFPIMKMSRPFLMIIFESNSQSILFMGRITNPNEN
ncbi:alpha-1-antiproteinase-like [Sceloporus undulatus]|uniref:alpha-1-antiproteinase-like n=1 Tax=Sceloporus undulatus TaxID=8520 RepID=UPI001C4C91B3|nr:alpha-1-antiproteinase-like [Sceloporus undulatus]